MSANSNGIRHIIRGNFHENASEIQDVLPLLQDPPDARG
jgi:hypothetical protein